jgi:hypothetical protein
MLCPQLAGVKWGLVAGKGEEVETVPGGLIMQAERSASGGDEIRVEDPLEPDHFFKNQAV